MEAAFEAVTASTTTFVQGEDGHLVDAIIGNDSFRPA